jgi:hypothetical protein
MKEHLKNLEEMNSEQEEWIKKLEGDRSEYGRQVKALKEKLAAIGAAATEAVA